MRLSRRDLYAALGTGYRDTLLTYRGTHPSGCYGVAIAHVPSILPPGGLHHRQFQSTTFQSKSYKNGFTNIVPSFNIDLQIKISLYGKLSTCGQGPSFSIVTNPVLIPERCRLHFCTWADHFRIQKTQNWDLKHETLLLASYVVVEKNSFKFGVKLCRLAESNFQ